MAGRRQTEEERPHFFLSYARSHYRPEDSDRWVGKFYNDLCHDISQTTGARIPGFMDRQIPPGSDWSEQLADALANCRVFVALFSPAYFTSEYCGKELAAFLTRYHDLVGELKRPPAIIPAMWTPMHLSEIPESLHGMQNTHPELPRAYRAEGLYGIMKLGRFREHYKETVLRLAAVIRQRAAECDLGYGPVPDLARVRSTFAGAEPGGGRPAVRLTLAAQALDQLPPERDAYYYGRTAREWTPFRGEDHMLPIGSFAEHVLTELGHRSIVDTADDPLEDPVDGPGVLVVDPWAARDQAIGKRLRQLDREPVHVLAPFNTDDRQTAEAAAGLTEDLVEVLPEGTALRGSALGIASPHAFRDALPRAVNEAFGLYLRTTSVHPPRTPPSTTHRPTLRDPDA